MPKPVKKKSRNKRSESSKNEECTYCIEILDWELPYLLSVNFNMKLVEGPFWEHMNLSLSGRLICPEKLANKNIEIIIIGDRRLVSMVVNPEKYQFEPSSVGRLTIRGTQRDFLGSVPFDLLNGIGFLLNIEKIKFLVLNGKPLHYGGADIRSIHFLRDYTPEDWM